MTSKTLKGVFMEEAASGITEVSGRESNPRIIEYFSTTTIMATDDAVPWCSAMMNWAVNQIGMTGTDSAASASWAKWGERLKKPVDGCIIGFIREDGSGHVGIYIGEDQYNYKILGGNQSDTVKISNFAKVKDYEGTRTWYFRRPKTVLNSATIVAGTVGATAGGIVLGTEVYKDMAATTGTQVEIPSVPNVSNTEGLVIGGDVLSALLVLFTFGITIWERVKKIRQLGV